MVELESTDRGGAERDIFISFYVGSVMEEQIVISIIVYIS